MSDVALLLQELDGWHGGLDTWVSVQPGISDGEVDITFEDGDENITGQYYVLWTQECQHEREGIVTNQPEFPPTFERAHASIASCARQACISAAQTLVAAKTNETAYWVADEEKK